MNIQNQIKRTLSSDCNIEYIKRQLEVTEFPSRTSFAKQLCKHFNFFDTTGKLQLSGCLKALSKLCTSGLIKLPESKKKKKSTNTPRRLKDKTSLVIDNPPTDVNAIKSLELVLVETVEHREIWNELMITEHYLGNAVLVGHQLRYLIRSEHGWLGGIGYGAAALNLSARDRWIGWTKEQSDKYLQSVVNMSRFLIRPKVKCPNLASKVLGMSIPQFVKDFERRYHFRPLLLETFVDTERYQGTCYQAANWLPIGQTKGRGRQDTACKAELSKKTIYVYPLEKDFRKQLGLAENAGLGALKIGEGLEADKWAEQEFGQAPVGDKRLGKRLVKAAHDMAQTPGRAYAGTVQGDWAATKAYYRMIDQPEDSQLTMENILAPHREQTARRMKSEKVVLCIQDGSEINYTNLNKCTGLGELKANQTGAITRGLNLHSTFAVTTTGLPLGVLKSQALAPTFKSPDDKRKPSKIPIEEKKSFVWIEHHRDLLELSASMPHTKLIDVCDREADFFELFDEYRNNPRVDLLIRAKHNRNLPDESEKLFDSVRFSPEQGQINVPVPKQSARAKKSKQKAKIARPARMATLSLRAKTIQLPAPEYFPDKDAIEIQIIHALEQNPPRGCEPIEWFLLTTIKIDTQEDIEKCLRWYTLRWRIEDFHRVLKSGCNIDKLAHETAERLRRAIAINLVIAWRIMLMTLMGRETPDLPAEILFTDIELRTMRALAKKKYTIAL